ncbi:hypothetical protein A9Q96_04310 [Rhodobacterales bacterium 52_120_T64]|nr:hypothetical protein A9Q96_04310 [Rhodobacterales bacterium 52_120_T64]
MGLISKWLGLGEAAQNVGGAVETVAEVFTVNKTKAELAVRAQAMASLGQYSGEFINENAGWFDSFINGINRLPRPILALGTVGLFVFAMANPEGFTTRMQGLAYVPDPLWWLLGAVVSFYFGARELHYARGATTPLIIPTIAANEPTAPDNVSASAFPENAALSEWAELNNQAA